MPWRTADPKPEAARAVAPPTPPVRAQAPARAAGWELRVLPVGFLAIFTIVIAVYLAWPR